MAGLGQVLMARDMADDRSAFNKDLRNASKQAQKRSRWGGIGRGLLSLAGGALGGPLGAGLGSFIGSKLGSGMAGGHKEIQDRRFFNDEIDKAQNTFADMKSNELGSQLARGARDAFTAYLNPKMFDAFKPGALQAKFSGAGTIPKATIPEVEKVVGSPSIMQTPTGRMALPKPDNSILNSLPKSQGSGFDQGMSYARSNLGKSGMEMENVMGGGGKISVGNEVVDIPALPSVPTGYEKGLAYANSSAGERGRELANGGFTGESETIWSGPYQQTRLPSIQEAQGFINSGGKFPSADSFQGPVVPFTGTGPQNKWLAQAQGLDPNRSIIDQLDALGIDSSKGARGRAFADLQRMGRSF